MRLSQETSRKVRFGSLAFLFSGQLIFGLFFFALLYTPKPIQGATYDSLANGLALVLEQDKNSSVTSVCLLVRGGCLAEPPDKEGLSYLTARLGLDAPDTDFLRDLMKTGSEVRISSRGDFLLLTLDCLSAQFESTMKMLTKTLSRPLFSGLRVNGIKEIMKSNQKKEEEDPDTWARVFFLEAFFGPNGYGARSFGTPLSLKNIKGDDAASFHKKYFVGSNLVVAVVSDLEEEEVKRILGATLGKLPPGEPFMPKFPVLTFPRPEEKREGTFTRPALSSYVAVAFPLPSLSPENFVLANVLEHILGRGPGSKIWPLRLEEKLAYEVGARVTIQQAGGFLQIYLKTYPEKQTLARQRLEEKIKEISLQGISEEDLKMGCGAFRSSIFQARESKSKRAEALAIYAGWGWEKDFETRLLDLISSLSLEKLRTYASTLFDLNRAVFLTIGPKAEAN